MTPFDAIRALCNQKDCSVLDEHEWSDLGMSTYMVNRWVSMTGRHNALMVNRFNNDRRLSGIRTPRESFELLSQLTVPFGRMKYHKKGKKDSEDECCRELSADERNLGLSSREREMYDSFLESMQ